MLSSLASNRPDQVGTGDEEMTNPTRNRKELTNDDNQTLSEWLWKAHPSILMEYMNTIKEYRAVTNKEE